MGEAVRKGHRMLEPSRLPPGATVIEAQGVSKTYETGKSPSSLFVERVFGIKGKNDTFEALKPLDLNIKIGTSVGILGRNGAGKSTLLNVLSGNTQPTTGKVTPYGRVAALIGIGQSFNIEDTGRANARRFCRMHGLSGEEAKEAVARVLDFSELGAHFERPVKTYSSGMKARLDFSCATFVRADLIIVDEVLAVGDAEFRSKCYGFMEASIEAGQTYLMVSHSPAVVGNYCNRALVLNEGRLIFDGDPLGGMQAYQSLISVGSRKKRSQEDLMRLQVSQSADALSAALALKDIHYSAADGDRRDHLTLAATGEVGRIHATFEVLSEIPAPRIACGLRNSKGIMITAAAETPKGEPWLPGETRRVTFEFDLRLAVGNYFVRLGVDDLSSGERISVFEREGAIELRFMQGPRTGIVDLGMRIVENVRQDADAQPREPAAAE